MPKRYEQDYVLKNDAPVATKSEIVVLEQGQGHKVINLGVFEKFSTHAKYVVHVSAFNVIAMATSLVFATNRRTDIKASQTQDVKHSVLGT